MGPVHRVYKRSAIAAALGGLVLAAGWAAGDTIWLQSGKGNPIALTNVKVAGVQGEQITFTTQAGTQTSKSLKQVPRIAMDDEPVFSAAEAAFEQGDWAAAIENYRKAAQASTKDWVKDRSSLRLVEAANRGGNFPAACAGFVELLQKNPALANDHKPAVPQGKADQLDPAIAQVKQAEQNPKLTGEQKTVLLNYLVEMYSAKGDTASANAVLAQLGKVAPADANAPGNRKIQADVKLTEARQAMAQKQYGRAIQTLNSSADVFADPQQQIEALFLLAQAREGAAKPEDSNGLKDAALAYMRVVANAKSVDGKPHLAESLLKTAAIEEKLKNPKEALALYNQVAAEFKGSPAAGEAEQGAARLSAAGKG